MDGSRDYHAKRSKSNIKRQISYDISYMWILKNVIQMKLLTKQKQTQTLKTNLRLPKRKGECEGIKLGVWDIIYNAYICINILNLFFLSDLLHSVL